MSDFLPRDVLIDVLARLPVKTLVQCTCVCKSWYSLLTSPSFITTHLNRSCLAKTNNNDNPLLLIQSRSGDNGDGVRYSLLRYSQAPSETEMFCDYAELELPLKSERDPYLRVIGCCNGLVCLSDDVFNYMEELHLWNPSIQKTMALHPLRVTYQSHGSFMHSIGFGFDSVTDDYKVVRIVYLLNGTSERFEVPPEIDIFSLSTGTWRNISHLGLQYTIREKAPQAYLNRAAHWLAYDTEMRKDFFFLIVSFHMGDEVFGEIMLPASMVKADSVLGVRVAKFQESLSLIDIRGTGLHYTCCIWVMKEYGISESWTKLFNIDMSRRSFNRVACFGGSFNRLACFGGSFKRVAGFTRHGEILFGTEDKDLVAYDPAAKRVVDLCIRGDSFYADAYTESIVLLGAKFHDTVTCKESPVLRGEASGANNSRKRRGKAKKKGKQQGCGSGGKSN